MSAGPEFGECPPGAAVRMRPGAYGVICDVAGRVLVLRTPKGYYLPGGGQDPGETAREALAREVREETGHALEVGAEIDRAVQHVLLPDGAVVRKEGVYFRAQLGPRMGAPLEGDHEMVWLEVKLACELLRPAAQAWVLGRTSLPAPGSGAEA